MTTPGAKADLSLLPILQRLQARDLSSHSGSGANEVSLFSVFREHLTALLLLFRCPLCGEAYSFTDASVGRGVATAAPAKRGRDRGCHATALSTCGHVFCYDCINRGIEYGCASLRQPPSSARQPAAVVDDSCFLNAVDRGCGYYHYSNNVVERRSGRGTTLLRCVAESTASDREMPFKPDRKKRVSFMCPICHLPAFKWMLIKLPLVTELSDSMRRTPFFAPFFTPTGTAVLDQQVQRALPPRYGSASRCRSSAPPISPCRTPLSHTVVPRQASASGGRQGEGEGTPPGGGCSSINEGSEVHSFAVSRAVPEATSSPLSAATSSHSATRTSENSLELVPRPASHCRTCGKAGRGHRRCYPASHDQQARSVRVPSPQPLAHHGAGFGTVLYQADGDADDAPAGDFEVLWAVEAPKGDLRRAGAVSLPRTSPVGQSGAHSRSASQRHERRGLSNMDTQVLCCQPSPPPVSLSFESPPIIAARGSERSLARVEAAPVESHSGASDVTRDFPWNAELLLGETMAL